MTIVNQKKKKKNVLIKKKISYIAVLEKHSSKLQQNKN